MRRLAVSALAAMLSALALAWPLAAGSLSGHRLVPGRGSAPHWRSLAAPVEAPPAWLAPAGPGRLGAVDAGGTLEVFAVTAGGLASLGRYGGSGSAEGPLVSVRLGVGRAGLAAVARDGRLLLWMDGALRSYDVGAPLSRWTAPAPVALSSPDWDDLVVVTADGALGLVAGLLAGPRLVARADVGALPDGRIAVADLDGDGLPEAAVLAEPTGRYPHAVLGDRLEAEALVVASLAPHALGPRGRLALPPPAVFEDLVPVPAPVDGGGRPGILLARSTPEAGASVVALGLGPGGLAVVAEGPPVGAGFRWTHVLGAADLPGDGVPLVLAVRTPHLGGVLTAYRRRGRVLAPVAQAAGYSSHAPGSRNLEQAALADLDGNGRPEVILPRQSRRALAGLELVGSRFVERWSLDLAGALSSNLLVADLDGDGLLDLALGDARGLRVLLSRP